MHQPWRLNNAAVCRTQGLTGAKLCILAYHCCRSGDPRSLDSCEFVRSLAVQLACGYWVPSGRRNFPAPHRRLECRGLGQHYASCLEHDPSVRAALHSEDPMVGLAHGVLAPLRAYTGLTPAAPVVLLVDSIDEGAAASAGQQTVCDDGAAARPAWNAKAGAFKAGMIESTADFPSLGETVSAGPQGGSLGSKAAAVSVASGRRLARESLTIPGLLARAVETTQLPDWLHLVITARCDEGEEPEGLGDDGAALVSRLSRAQLDVEKEVGGEGRRPVWWSDVQTYVENATRVGFVPTVSQGIIADNLCSLSQGNFLYVSTVLEDLHSERLGWADIRELQPGVSFLLSRHLSSSLGGSPELRLAVEVLMAGGGVDGGIATRVIEEAVQHGLRPDGARSSSLTTARLERRLSAVPKRLLTCTKTEGDGGTHRWRLSHESIRRWLASDAQMPLSAAHGHQMLAARLACRLAVASLRPALAEW